MNTKELIVTIKDIVREAVELKNVYTNQRAALVNYACIFSQSEEEYELLIELVDKIGEVLKTTPTGLLYQVNPIETVAGPLRIVKIRKPDSTRPEKGDADFAAINYIALKNECLGKPGFALIARDTFEMIEILDPAFGVRVYFSNPPVEKQYKLK